MAAHRYWRVLVTAVQSGNTAAIAEARLFDASMLDQIGSGTASASSAIGGDGAANAFDGAVGTFWANNTATLSAGTTWLKYDFGSGNDKDIRYLKIVGRNDSFAGSQSPKDFKLQFSDDDSAWSDYVAVTGQASWGTLAGARYYDSGGFMTDQPPPGIPATTKEIWRVRASAVDGSNVFAVAEIYLRTTPGGAQQASGGTAIGHSFLEGTYASVFDGNTTSYWASGSVFPAWVGYQFATAKNIVEVAIRARVSWQTQAPVDFTIDYWDVDHWETAHSVTGETGWASGEVRTFTFGAAPVVRPVCFVTT